MQEIELSIVIPNYNKADFIPQCIESVVHQSYQGKLEIIIVDDCSTDNSSVVIKSLEEKYAPMIRPILLKQNGRVSNARNVGLQNAKGKYITFLDSDDFYYDGDKLSREIETVKKFSSDKAKAISFSKTVPVDYEGKNPVDTHQIVNVSSLYHILIFDISSKIVMRDYIAETDTLRSVGGYNTDRNLFEDYELLLKLSKNNKFVFSGGLGTAYRDSQAGLSKRPQSVLEAEKKKVIFEEIRRNPLPLRLAYFSGYYAVHAVKKIIKSLKNRR